jgi:predicted PurR-regulated permease PerM
MVSAPDDQPTLRGPAEPPARVVQSRLLGILGLAAVLALLYFAREVLIPITLAVMLGFLVTPLVNGLRRVGLGHTASVWTAVAALVLLLSAIAAVIGTQLVRMGASLPQYEETMRGKLASLDQMTLGRLGGITGPVRRMVDRVSEDDDNPAEANAAKPLQVEVRQTPLKPLQLLSRVLGFVWGPLASAGIVIVVLIFVLLEQEALRDRFIRLAGSNDLRATTVAVNDAGERLAHFFAYQFAVNLTVGAVLWAGLVLLGHSQALLWAAVAALLRFVPYIGLWIAAAGATLFAAALEPGWSVAAMTLSLFVVVELLVSQLVEPFLYGRTTGLSPLSVVIAAIFWSWIWGPVGLVVSTPLTLCLVVAGRYFKALNALEILLGEVPALTLPQNFYQRVLSGNAAPVIERARLFLKSKSFAAYCDAVLMPAMHLARLDVRAGMIDRAEQLRFRAAVAEVIETLSGPQRRWRRQPASLLADVNLGRQLRDRRELLSARQPLPGPAGCSQLLCVGAGTTYNELAAEVLVRVLAQAGIDGRHLLLEDLGDSALHGADPAKVAAVCLVSLQPCEEAARMEELAREVHASMPRARILALVLQGPYRNCDQLERAPAGVDLTAQSYEDMLKICVEMVGMEGAGAGVARDREAA